MLKFKTWFILSLICLIAGQLSYGQEHYIDRWYASPFFSRLTADDGLSSPSVSAICQDYQGFMWFGTANGLDRYDGHEIKSYRSDITDELSITNSNVSNIIEDSKNRLWIGTTNGLNLYNREKNNFIRFLNDLNDEKSIGHNQIEDIIEDSKGNIWIATYNGLNLWNESDSSFTRYFQSDDKNNNFSQITALLEDRFGDLWLGTQYGGLCKFNPDTGKCEQVYAFNADDQHSIPSNFVWDIYEDDQGTFFVSTFHEDISILDRNTGTFTNLNKLTKKDSTINKPQAWVIGEGLDGKTWFGMGESLLIWDGNIRNPNRFITIKSNSKDPERSLNSSDILSMHQSDDGMVWMGGRNGGVSYISKQSIRFFHYNTTNYNLTSDNIASFAEDNVGNIWIGTDGGGVNIFDPKYNTINPLAESFGLLGSKAILSLRSNDTGMWIGMWDGGAKYYDYNEKKIVLSLSDICATEVKNVVSITIDSKGTVWLGTWDEGLISYNPVSGECNSFNSDDDNLRDISGNDIISVYADSKDRIWFSVYGRGFDIYDQTTNTFQNYQPFPSSNGLANDNIITSFLEDSHGDMWIGSKGAGLLKFNVQTGEFEYFKNKYGLPDGEVNSIIEKNSNELWISSSKGLYQFDTKGLKSIHYNKTSGLNGSFFKVNSSYLMDGGGMYFGGFHGFNYFHPDSIILDKSETPLRFLNFKIFNETVDLAAKDGAGKDITVSNQIKLDYKESVFSIQFAALNFTNSLGSEYKYRLVDFDKDWVYTNSSNRTVTYTNLDPGEYDFQVLATNNDGKWNDTPENIKISIRPPFWETNWFRAIAILFIVGGILMLHNIRLKYLNRQNTLLEEEIKERTKEVNQKNHELTETIEELQTTQTQLVLSEKMAALGQLTASVAHEVNTPLGAINSSVDSIKADLPEIIKEFPSLARVFTSEEFEAFYEILERAKERKVISTKEGREYKRELKKKLDAIGVDNSQLLASYLLEINADIDSHACLILLKHENALAIFQTAAKISKIRNLTDNISTSVQQASKVTFALKKYSYNSQNPSREKFDLKGNILGVLPIFNSQLQNAKMSLELPEQIQVEGYPSELSQVWINLIQNSLHAIKGAGEIKISLIPNGSKVVASIQDDGSGVSNDIQDKIFDPFFTTKPFGQGSGLGLDIVNKIVKKHNGSISFDSDASGTVFNVVLPYKYAKE